MKDVLKVMSVFGTRPEAIKMCPLVIKMQEDSQIESIVCVSAQHRQMLDQVLEIFGVKADIDLNIMRKTQTLTTITSDVLNKMSEVFAEIKPNIVLVHGDTTTTFAVALSAYYHQIPVGHVEAGLRSFDIYSPYPEEINRRLTSQIAALHFAPTVGNMENLKNENISTPIYVTGNTVIDALSVTVKKGYVFKNEQIKKLNFSKNKLILVTAHRRENLGAPLENICNAIKKIAAKYSSAIIVYPVHLNPAVQNTVFKMLGKTENIHLTEPIDVEDMHNLMAKATLVLTDSGGLQEEAPSLGIPVLVMRTETERPEAVKAGTVTVVGVKEQDIYQKTCALLDDKVLYDKMANAVNPYGDGRASERIIKAIKEWAY